MMVPRWTRRAALRALGAVAPLPLLSGLPGCGRGPGAGPASPLTGGWATGGTAAMKGVYPDPFASGHGAACSLTCSATVGPCHAATLVRRDISEGHAGLPGGVRVDAGAGPVGDIEDAEDWVHGSGANLRIISALVTPWARNARRLSASCRFARRWP